MKLRVLIADDEPVNRERLRQLLRAESWIEIVAECANGRETIEAIRKKSPGLVFLHTKMPELDGFAVLEAICGTRLPAIILVTIHDKLSLRAFEVHAVQRSVKPFDRERFQTVLQRARERLQPDAGERNNASLSGPPALPPTRRNRLERVSVKSQGRIAILKTAEIDWICAADNYVELHVGKKSHFLRMTIGALADQLPPQFVRISRSLLVNLGRISEIRPKSHGDCLVVMENGTRLTASRNYRRNLVGLLSNSC
jgi:two-component system LytT family response regulator